MNKIKDEYIDINWNKSIEVFKILRLYKDKINNWGKTQIAWIFFNKHIYELCEKWIYCDGNYAYTRFEELRTRSGEVLFTREYKGVLSEKKSNTYINIDKLNIFKDFSSKDPTTLKTKNMDKSPLKTKDMDKTIPKTKDMDKTMPKTENKNMLDKTNNKISKIIKLVQYYQK